MTTDPINNVPPQVFVSNVSKDLDACIKNLADSDSLENMIYAILAIQSLMRAEGKLTGKFSVSNLKQVIKAAVEEHAGLHNSHYVKNMSWLGSGANALTSAASLATMYFAPGHAATYLPQAISGTGSAFGGFFSTESQHYERELAGMRVVKEHVVTWLKTHQQQLIDSNSNEGRLAEEARNNIQAVFRSKTEAFNAMGRG